MQYLLEGVGFFLPYLVSTALLALLFGLFMHGKFDPQAVVQAPAATGTATPAAARRWVKIGRAATFFFMFAAFGMVVAYFLSLGIKEESPDIWVNPLISEFATPLIALLTAGVGFFAKREAPEGAVIVVPAGVICFLVECLICYRGMFSQIIGDR